MVRIGITGSIAMGKSTIAKIFTYFGIPVHDSDLEVRILINKNKNVIKKIEKHWPEVFNKEKKINKLKLREIIFSKNKEKLKLEKILHPLVKKKQVEFKKKHNKHKFLAFDIPLLYETRQEKDFDYIFLANCSKETQIKRAMKRENLDINTFNRINSSQLCVKEKIRYKPIIINTEYPKLFVFLNILLKLIIIKFKEIKYDR